MKLFVFQSTWWKMEKNCWKQRRWLLVLDFEILHYLLLSATIDIWSIFRNIRVSKMSIFINFDLDLHFQGHLLQELDHQTQYNHFGENLMKIGQMCQSYSIFFLFFQVTHFPPGKTKLCNNLRSCRTLL